MTERWPASLAACALLVLAACEPKAPVAVPVAVAPPPSPWARADNVALSAPQEAAGSIATLAAYLAPAEASDEEKARAIFRWITSHVAYDVEGYRSGLYESSDATATLKRMTAVCEGYSSLFEALAAKAGLECATIHGYAKGAGYRVGESFSGPSNHAWNAVRYGGTWRLVDCTWGAGALDESGRYVHAFEPFYFDTPPERFIYTHWPSEERWQLMDRPVTKDSFEKLPWLKPAFFVRGLDFMGGVPSFNTGGQTARLGITIPAGVEVQAYLLRGEEKLQPKPLPMAKNGGGYLIEAVLPSPGSYLFRIYAGRGEGNITLEWAADIEQRWDGKAGSTGVPAAGH